MNFPPEVAIISAVKGSFQQLYYCHYFHFARSTLQLIPLLQTERLGLNAAKVWRKC